MRLSIRSTVAAVVLVLFIIALCILILFCAKLLLGEAARSLSHILGFSSTLSFIC